MIKIVFTDFLDFHSINFANHTQCVFGKQCSFSILQIIIGKKKNMMLVVGPY